MTEGADTAEERLYYLASALLALATVGVTLWRLWKFTLDDAERERIRGRLAEVSRPWKEARRCRHDQAVLTFEVFTVLEELERYNDERGLAERLSVA